MVYCARHGCHFDLERVLGCTLPHHVLVLVTDMALVKKNSMPPGPLMGGLRPANLTPVLLAMCVCVCGNACVVCVAN